MRNIRVLLVCALSTCASGALAADPQSFAARTYSWSGFYLGGQVGYGRDTAKSSLQTPAGNVLAEWNGSAYGVIGGVYSGYNWQLGALVFGVESDFEGASLNKVSGPTLGLYSRSKVAWQASLRTRIGLAVDRSLFYVTSGLADASLEQTLYDAGHSVAFTTNRLGYTVGGGFEYAVTDNLVGRMEYRYSGFGAGNNALNVLNWVGVTGNNYERRVTEQAVRFGVGYKFGN